MTMIIYSQARVPGEHARISAIRGVQPCRQVTIPEFVAQFGQTARIYATLQYLEFKCKMLFVPREIVGLSPSDRSRPVYMQEWFTEIAARSDEARRFVVVENGKRIAGLTIALVRNGLGMKQAYDPPWARLCGPSLPDSPGGRKKTEAIRQLPTEVSYFLTIASEFNFKLRRAGDIGAAVTPAWFTLWAMSGFTGAAWC